MAVGVVRKLKIDFEHGRWPTLGYLVCLRKGHLNQEYFFCCTRCKHYIRDGIDLTNYKRDHSYDGSMHGDDF